jgi:hypothetical protein
LGFNAELELDLMVLIGGALHQSAPSNPTRHLLPDLKRLKKSPAIKYSP